MKQVREAWIFTVEVAEGVVRETVRDYQRICWLVKHAEKLSREHPGQWVTARRQVPDPEATIQEVAARSTRSSRSSR